MNESLNLHGFIQDLVNYCYFVFWTAMTLLWKLKLVLFLRVQCWLLYAFVKFPIVRDSPSIFIGDTLYPPLLVKPSSIIIVQTAYKSYSYYLRFVELNWFHATFFCQSQVEHRAKESDLVHSGQSQMRVKSGWKLKELWFFCSVLVLLLEEKTLGGLGWVCYTVTITLWTPGSMGQKAASVIIP